MSAKAKLSKTVRDLDDINVNEVIHAVGECVDRVLREEFFHAGQWMQIARYNKERVQDEARRDTCHAMIERVGTLVFLLERASPGRRDHVRAQLEDVKQAMERKGG